MIRRLFGKRELPSRNNEIEIVLIPKGTAESTEVWAMAEALDMFVREAQESALFEPNELPADAVAVAHAYEFANALADLGIGGWFSSTTGERPAAEVVRGLRLIGAGEMADVLHESAEVWRAGGSEDQMKRFRTTRQLEEPLIGQCSEWVRSSPRTVILGDGKLDTEYKEVMKQLYRCNQKYARRGAIEDQRRIRLGLKPKVRTKGTSCTLDELIAEIKQAHG